VAEIRGHEAWQSWTSLGMKVSREEIEPSRFHTDASYVKPMSLRQIQSRNRDSF
jgi:hypothetical protein